MKRNNLAFYGIGLLVAAFLLMSNVGIAQADDIGAWKTKTLSGKIVKIDSATRELVLADKAKSEVIATVDTNVKNLDTFKVGDKVKVKVYVAVATEVLKATDAKAAFAELPTTYDPPANTAPLGGKLKMFKDVVKVIGVDNTVGMLQVKDSRNKVFTFDAANKAWMEGDKNAKKIKAGDKFIVTFTQPLIVSISK